MPNFIQQLLQQAMKKKGGDLIAPVLNRSVGKLGPRDLPTRFTPTQPLRSFPGRPVQAPGLPSPPARVATKGVSPYAVGGTAVVGGGALGVGIAATDQIEGALNRVGPAVDRFFGQITPQAIQQFGKEQENKGWGGALEMATPLGFLAAPFIPNTRPSSKTSGSRPVGTQAVLNGKPVYWGGDDYGWQLLNGTGSSATLNSLNAPGTQGRFIQDTAPRSPGAAQGGGGGFSGAGSFAPIDPYAAQNREYERERARVEAMVKANPDMQKQAIADERAKVRDQGMAIWAAKYGAPGGLASQVKPGAVGYDAIQRGIGIQELPSLEKRAEFTWNQATQGPTPAVPMADAMLNPAGPGFIGGEGDPPLNFADPRFKNMSPKEFQNLLNQYTKR
jgi:hypothetical protein